MYALYVPVLFLQAFCVYHAHRNNAEQRWYWLILLFPLVGSIIYLFQNFNNRVVLNRISENAKEIVYSDYRVERLERALEFSETVTNRMNLADAYMEVGRYQDAIPHYSASLHGFMTGDPSVRMKLLYAHFMSGNYEEVVHLGHELESEKSFRKAEQRITYAWALYYEGDAPGAESVFRDMDHSFTNYLHRIEYCKFLLRTEKTSAAKGKLSELLEEFEQMQETERRQKKPMQREIKAMFENLVRPA